jgi:signal transduction histidine kinase
VKGWRGRSAAAADANGDAVPADGAGWAPCKPRRRHWRHSLGKRLILVFVLLALAMTAVFMGGMQRAYYGGWREAAQPLIGDYIDRLAASIGTPPDVARARALTERLPISIRIEGPVVNWDSHPGRRSEEGRGDLHGGANSGWLTRTTADGHRIRFGLSDPPWENAPHGVGWITLALLLALILAAFAYVRRLLRPLDDIRAGAERFGRGAFDEPIPLRRRDELGDLAQRINTMAHDIQAMLDAKRALLLALSHELRSPLTRARLNAELLPATPEGAAEREALLRDLNEMRDLISDLLESERLASPHSALQREPVDVAALVRATVAEMPDGQSIGLALAPGLPLYAADRLRLRLLLRNLLDNALRYSAEAQQPPQVTLRPMTQGGEGVATGMPGLALEVRDFGPGVEASQLARLAEPFYRTDSARQRATGGVGLGMHLCRLIAEAHGGSFAAHNASPGLRIEVLLPAPSVLSTSPSPAA